MFQGQFDLEDQGQGLGHQFSNFSETFMWSIHGSSLKVKFKTIQKLSKGTTQTITTRLLLSKQDL